ncbi:DUF3995 domain-containing protein [Salinispora vitiensis]|uniref:DUF3995 domain-containing protein n=1 Tax=Salinispora vitiensis TaxID=999544 RepID=UPI00295A7C5B|nr:DUF3995 domain-containing protein [Salinispora vitiensis]
MRCGVVPALRRGPSVRALGGRTGFVAATGSADLLEYEWFVVVGLWDVALALLVGGAGCLATVTEWGRRLPDWSVRTVLWAGGCVLALRAVLAGVQDVLLEVGALRPSPGFDWSVVHWRLALWTLWFSIGAVLFLVTAFLHHGAVRRRTVNRE